MSHKSEVIDKLVNVYRSIARYPLVVSGHIFKSNSNGIVKIESKWSQRNLEKKEITTFQKFHFLSLNSENVSSDPIDISTEQLSRYSNSEKFKCVLRDGGSNKDSSIQQQKKKQFLEIWDNNCLYKNFDVEEFDVHGSIYFDGEFGSLEWSPDDSKVLYIAEKKPIKGTPFYKQKSDDSKQGAKESVLPGGEYLYRPDWGEQLGDKHQPVVAICNIKSECLQVLEGIPAEFSPGQVIWSKDGEGVFGIVLNNEPRRLGLIYCTNRKGYVFYLGLNGKFEILSEENKSVRSPRLSLDGKYLFWLQRSSGGPHDGCQELVKYEISSRKIDIIVPIVRRPSDFCGIYAHALPRRCFSGDGEKIFFSTINKAKVMSYYAHLDTKKVVPIQSDASAVVLDVFNDMILISTSSLNVTPSVKLSTSISNIKWVSLTSSEMAVKDCVIKFKEFTRSGVDDDFNYFNAIYFGPVPKNEEPTPLIVYPHGGPHSCVTDSFGIEGSFFVSLGFGVLYVNYRGSTGVGEDGVQFLPGRIGESDVKDNHFALEEILRDIPYLDKNKVVLCGGSHGGFLVTHLSAQYPDTFKAVVARNPVIDITSMYSVTDIPDWCTIESGFVFDQSKPLNVEQASKMLRASPMYQANNVKAPTLILIGRKDLRVPFSQGMCMYNTLKARNIKTRLHLYEDNHPLAQVPVHMDVLINASLWFLEQLDLKL